MPSVGCQKHKTEQNRYVPSAKCLCVWTRIKLTHVNKPGDIWPLFCQEFWKRKQNWFSLVF